MGLEDRKKEQTGKEERIAMRVSAVSIIANAVLSAGKLTAGVAAHSGAMISDAVHSASDVFSTIVVMIGVHLAAKKSDADHPYGHERLECVAAIVLAVALAVTGAGIGVSGVRHIAEAHKGALVVPGIAALMAAVVSIFVKEAMFWYTRHYAKAIDSGALMADAWHHRSDALSSVGALIGIAGARMGFPVFDSVASVVICVFILKAAYDIFKDAVDKMVDKSCEVRTEQEMRDCISEQDGVLGIDMLHTRVFGNKIYVDVEILVNGQWRLYEAHGVAERVHDELERRFPKVKHIMVHVNPCACGADGKTEQEKTDGRL
ncbi:MAG: cation diffusion facilitator family transporter [bacterium]|nr:cation diffusion facilitator family transporter [bacterium]